MKKLLCLVAMLIALMVSKSTHKTLGEACMQGEFSLELASKCVDRWMAENK